MVLCLVLCVPSALCWCVMVGIVGFVCESAFGAVSCGVCTRAAGLQLCLLSMDTVKRGNTTQHHKGTKTNARTEIGEYDDDGRDGLWLYYVSGVFVCVMTMTIWV